jgi:predicted AAA+ superfamily ATPase
MIPRPDALKRISAGFRIHPVMAILGPRQCGKTTLARMFADRKACTHFDLEDPVDVQRLSNPMRTLEPLAGLVVIDEIQRKPELFELLRVLVDRKTNRARFLVLGSASPFLVRNVSESLAGRVGFVDLSGFDLREVGTVDQERLWVRGGFPRSFLAADEVASMAWRSDFIRTFLERDIPQLGITIPAETLRRFWTMVAHYHGQVWSGAEFARSLGVSEPTARRYLDILAGAYMIRILPPWFENMRKRQVKAAKIYIRDSGLLHALLQLQGLAELQGHPKLGASWEGFALEQTLSLQQTRDAYFWGTHSGAELDLMFVSGGKRYGLEYKYADAPSRSRSMLVALEDLGLEHLWVVFPGEPEYPLDQRITALPMKSVPGLFQRLQRKRR